jgi:hypothetical protein
VFQNCDHPFFPSNAQFSNFFNNPNAIIADKTHFIPLLEKGSFEYMFLRPRRWGKSTFLNMLAAYYDVKTHDLFEEIFGGLYIGRTPTKSRNSHLILLFNFSTIVSIGSFEEVERSIFDTVSVSLHRFLRKYQDILGDALPEKYIVPGSIGTSLKNVLGRQTTNLLAGAHSQSRILCRDETILWHIGGEVLAYRSATSFPRWNQPSDGYAGNLVLEAVLVVVRLYTEGC